MNGIIPTLDEAKRQAKRLRADMAASGTDLSHGRSLEIVAHQHGYRDWNTFHATIGNGPPREEARRTCAPVEIGQTVRGTYLGQPFLGQVLSVHMMGTPARYAVEIDFDEPVDVVTFDSFSSFRKRVRTTVDAAGVSTSKTSDGEPHMRLIL